MNRTNIMYRGPRAWLIWFNLLLACLSLVPYILAVIIFPALIRMMESWHLESLKLPAMVVFLLLGAISELGAAAYAAVLVSTVILLSVPGIPWKVKVLTAAIELGACAVLWYTVTQLKGQFSHVLFG